MTTTLSPPIKLAPYLWRYEWTGTAPFRVFDYWDYKYLKPNTTDTRIDVISYFEDQPNPIQVLDSTEGSIDGEIYPGRVRIQWRGMANADYYEISVGSGAIVLNTVKETGAGYYEYTFQYPLLEGLNTIAIDIICYDIVGNSKTLTLPIMQTAYIPTLLNAKEITYDSGTTTLSIGDI